MVTVTLAVPTVAISEANIAAVICVLLTKVVALEAPLKLTVAPVTKPTPLTVCVNAAAPAAALEGKSELIVGTALLIVNETPFDVPPDPGFVTVTGAVPAVAIAAVSCVALTNVVVLAAQFDDRCGHKAGSILL